MLELRILLILALAPDTVTSQAGVTVLKLDQLKLVELIMCPLSSLKLTLPHSTVFNSNIIIKKFFNTVQIPVQVPEPQGVWRMSGTCIDDFQFGIPHFHMGVAAEWAVATVKEMWLSLFRQSFS